MKKNKTDAPTLESALDKLQAITEEIEKNEINLEDAMKAFEEGIALIRDAQKILSESEQKVKTLIEANDGPEESTFPATESSE